MATAAELKARLAKYATPKQEISDDTTKSPASNPPAEQLPPQVPSTPAVVAEGVVNTNVQSTALVVVERPSNEQRVVDNGSELATTDLDNTNPVHQGFLQRLHELEEALLARDPLMRTHLAEIHKALIQYEEITNLLRPEEIAKIMAAQQVHTNMILTKEVVKKTAAATRTKAAKISMDDV